MLDLSLSSCSVTQFSCASGICIPLNKRCDFKNDCPDKSDEAKCNKVGKVMLKINHFLQVWMDPTYQKFLAPTPLEGDNKTKARHTLDTLDNSFMM